MIDVNNFEYMKIGLASPEKIAHGLMAKLKNLKQSITVR
ncbi:DNA-directed RNA polymerase subunit beta' [Virgibacillus sp. 179-BFC.A HS]|uniref:DNA-directed RNA polymerase subunit beta n=1 Tax=Tigheibacillus jepli TaxID=3035914 RepID=A0ABU5CNB5_9BACI|nr:DNA-directed RNA polymerase subunit beta' [Virgibacillus sp. 179-BFC.A HS]MDY0407294.1 DNA-directed RNA polymerase subunit beta' [Virgibacillus sp. 179-BFC.A HS]